MKNVNIARGPDLGIRERELPLSRLGSFARASSRRASATGLPSQESSIGPKRDAAAEELRRERRVEGVAHGSRREH